VGDDLLLVDVLEEHERDSNGERSNMIRLAMDSPATLVFVGPGKRERMNDSPNAGRMVVRAPASVRANYSAAPSFAPAQHPILPLLSSCRTLL
jgi:hypothetical protein